MGITRRRFLKGAARAALLSTAYHPALLGGLLRVPPAVAQDLPGMPSGFGNGQRVAVIGAGIAGLTSAYELLKAGFDVTVYEAKERYGGRSLTVRPSDADYKAWYLANSRFVRSDSYCDFISAEVRGAKVGRQTAEFVPALVGDDYFDLYFNTGPGRIPTHHTGVLHYCRLFGVDMEPYIFVGESNLLHSDRFNGGKPVQFREFRNSMRGYLSEMLHSTAGEAVPAETVAADPQSPDELRQLLDLFGSLSSGGRFEGTTREGYTINPGAGTNAGVGREPLALVELLDAKSLWPDLVYSTSYDWQLPLLQPVGGMDMIWQAFLAQQVAGSELRDRVRLQHEVTGFRYAEASGATVMVSYNGPDGQGEASYDYVVMTGLPVHAAQLDAQGVVDDGVRALLRSVVYLSGGKYGWQARTRFWEESDVGIFGGISWTDHVSEQLWYPSSGYNGPTGILTGAYMFDINPIDSEGRVYQAVDSYREPVDPSQIPAIERRASRWAAMDQAQRTEQTLIGCEALHPGFREKVYEDAGLSISWNNQPFEYGIGVADMPVTRPDAYARLIRPIDRSGRVYLAGDYVSYESGWQEGAVRSAWWTLGQIRDHVLAHGG